MVLSGLVGGCAGWSSGRAVRTVAGMARPAVCVQDGGACCPHGAGGGGLVRGGAGACLLCQCARAPDRVEVNALRGR